MANLKTTKDSIAPNKNRSQAGPSSLPLPLTAKEKAVLEFIEVFQGSSGICPSYQEIKDHFGFASFNSIQNYLKQLGAKGYIKAALNQKRAIQLLHSANALQSQALDVRRSSTGPPSQPLLQSKEEVLSLPFLGKVAAGQPLEALAHNEFLDVPRNLVRDAAKTFALKVQGQSMIDEGILDGDTLLVQQQSHAKNGDLVVATVDNEATVKRFYLRTPVGAGHGEMQVELRPSNQNLASMWFSPYEVHIQGIVVGLLRQF